MATVALRYFELTGADGGPLRGDVRTAQDGRGRPAVVICHGFKGFKNWGFFPHLAERLARANLTAVSFNFTGSGVGPDGESFSEPDRFAHATFSNDLADLASVWDRTARGELVDGVARPTRMGLFGHSRGGGVAVLFAANRDDCRALVTWAAIAGPRRWDAQTVAAWRADGKIDVVNARTGEVLPVYTDMLDDIERHEGGTLDMLAAAGRLRLPWLIVHGAADEAVAPSEAQALYGAAASGVATLTLVPSGTHTFGARHPWAGATPELEQVMDRTVEWFSRHLL